MNIADPVKTFVALLTNKFEGGSGLDSAVKWNRFFKDLTTAKSLLLKPDGTFLLPEEVMTALVKTKLGDEPLSLLHDSDVTIDCIIARLEMRYLNDHVRWLLHEEAKALKCGDSYYEWALKLHNLLKLSDPHLDQQRIIFNIRNRAPTALHQFLLAKDHQNLSLLFSDLMQLDANRPKPTAPPLIPSSGHQSSSPEEVNMFRRYKRWERDHQRGKKKPLPLDQKKSSPVICHICGKENHLAKHCLLRKDRINEMAEVVKEESTSDSINSDEYVGIPSFPSPPSDSLSSTFVDIISKFVDVTTPFRPTRQARRRLIFKDVFIGNKCFKALIDTGCTTIAINDKLVKHFDSLGFSSKSVDRRVQVASSKIIPANLSYDIIAVIDSFRFTLPALVIINLSHDIILGMEAFDIFDLSHCYDLDIPGRRFDIIAPHTINAISTNNNDRFSSSVDIIRMFNGWGPPKPMDSNISMKIDLIKDVDTVAKPRAYTLLEQKRLKELTDDLIRKKCIRRVEPAEFDYLSSKHIANSILIKKKGGSDRLVCDWTMLNTITKKISYPFPNITDISMKIPRSCWKSVIDIPRAFWNIKMFDPHVHITRFRTHEGIFEWLVMPMGISNSPAMFQSYLDFALSGLVGSICFCYIDDIIVFGDTIEEHDKNLKEVLHALWKAGLSVNWDKFQFRKEKVVFCGFEFSNKGIATLSSKFEPIKSIQRPKTIKQLRKFLGLTNQLRNFIKDYAVLISPLERFLSKTCSLKDWSSDDDVMFHKIKLALISPEVIHPPTPDGDFHIYTDASKSGAGWAVFQVQGGIQKLIRYGGKKFTKSQSKYGLNKDGSISLPESSLSTPKQELLAIYLACKDSRHFVHGHNLFIHTDHQAWSKLNRINPDPMILRWLVKIQELNPSISHIAGSSNLIADAISRLNENVTDVRISSIVSPDNNLDIILALNDARADLIKIYHEKEGAHLGINKTYDRMKSNYSWKGLYQDVLKVVSACHKCQLHKDSHTGDSRAHLTPIVSRGPFQTIGLDLFDMKVGNSTHHILGIRDYFSKWTDLILLKKTDSDSIIAALSEFFERNNLPHHIISDGGPQIISQSVEKFLRDLYITHGHSAPNHQQANGAVERMVGTVKPLIQIKLSEGIPIKTAILQVCKALNTAKVANLSHSPFEILHGFPANSVANNKIRYLKNVQQNILDKTTTEIDDNSFSKSLTYNADKSNLAFIPGDKVKVFNFDRKFNHSLPKFLGPFDILERLSNDNYLISKVNLHTGKPLSMNVQHLRPYYSLKHKPRDDARYDFRSTHSLQPIPFSPLPPPNVDLDQPPSSATDSSKATDQIAIPTSAPSTQSITPLDRVPIASPPVQTVSSKRPVPLVGMKIALYDNRSKSYVPATIASQLSSTSFGVKLDDHPTWDTLKSTLSGANSKKWFPIAPTPSLARPDISQVSKTPLKAVFPAISVDQSQSLPFTPSFSQPMGPASISDDLPATPTKLSFDNTDDVVFYVEI